MQPELDPVMSEIKAYGLETFVPIVSDEVGLFLKLITSLQKPKHILEIGCGISYSTHWFLKANSAVHVTAIDFNIDRIAISEKYLKKSGLLDRVTLIHQDALEFFDSNTQKFDLIFQDSTKKGYAGMIEKCYEGLESFGLFVADNIFFNQLVLGSAPHPTNKNKKGIVKMREFNQLMSQHPGFDTSFLSLGDGLMIAEKKN